VATSFYFNNFGNSQEQLLIENLVVESIKIYGHDVKYVPRTIQDKDKIYGEDTQSSKYTRAIDVEMYIKNVEGFEGEGDFLSKFNLQIRDQITFTIARRTFADEVGDVLLINRPREGDLVYFPLNKKLFEIKFVEHESVFYQLGSLQMYDLKCELFEYNSEVFDTGIGEIDTLYKTNSLDIQRFSLQLQTGGLLLAEDGYALTSEGYDLEVIDPVAENVTIEKEADTYLDFSELNPFSEDGTY
jgi:Virus neck protein